MDIVWRIGTIDQKQSGISPTKFPRLIIANTNGVYKWVVIIQFINCMNMPVYKLPHHNQLINGSILGDDNWDI